jgi:TetR/AcrR family transcriptional regulator
MGIAERKEREKERRKKEIINAAEKVFFKLGFDYASVEKVAEKAELSKATLYLYFKSKDELYFAICMRAQEKMYKLIDEALSEAKNTVEKIESLFYSIVEFQKLYPDYFRTMFHFQTHPMAIDPDSEMAIENKKIDQIYINHWITLVEKGKKEGIIRKDLDPVTTVLIFWMQLSGFLKMYSVLQSELDKKFHISEERLLKDYFKIIFDGIKTT